jgi:hypothetical protein
VQFNAKKMISSLQYPRVSDQFHLQTIVIAFVVIMALVDQAATFLHQYVYSWLHTTPSKTPDALKLGVISTAQINPAASQSTSQFLTPR